MSGRMNWDRARRERIVWERGGDRIYDGVAQEKRAQDRQHDRRARQKRARRLLGDYSGADEYVLRFRKKYRSDADWAPSPHVLDELEHRIQGSTKAGTRKARRRTSAIPPQKGISRGCRHQIDQQSLFSPCSEGASCPAFVVSGPHAHVRCTKCSASWVASLGDHSTRPRGQDRTGTNKGFPKFVVRRYLNGRGRRSEWVFTNLADAIAKARGIQGVIVEVEGRYSRKDRLLIAHKSSSKGWAVPETVSRADEILALLHQ